MADPCDDELFRVKVPWVDGRDMSTATTPVGFFMCGVARDGRPFLVGGDKRDVEYYLTVADAKEAARLSLHRKLAPCLEVAQSVRFSFPDPSYFMLPASLADPDTENCNFISSLMRPEDKPA